MVYLWLPLLGILFFVSCLILSFMLSGLIKFLFKKFKPEKELCKRLLQSIFLKKTLAGNIKEIRFLKRIFKALKLSLI